MIRLMLALVAIPLARAEIRDMLKGTDLDAIFARTQGSQVIHGRPNFTVSAEVLEGKAHPPAIERSADAVLVVHRGTARVSLGSGPPREYQVGRGDVIHIPRNTEQRIEPGGGRFEYLKVSIFPTGENLSPRASILAPRRMPDVVPQSEIDATFARFTVNQPLHGAPNFTMNYVIYNRRPGPWEAHVGCVDIYFLRVGTAHAEIGGRIRNAKEESPGEIRGTGVSGARQYTLSPGDLVLIPRNTPHHMDAGNEKLGYLLLKVWAE